MVTEAGRPASLGHSVGKASALSRAFCVSRVKPRKLGHLLSFQAPFQKILKKMKKILNFALRSFVV